VDGTIAFVHGDNYGDNEGQDARTEDDDEEEFAQKHLQVEAARGARGARGH